MPGDNMSVEIQSTYSGQSDAAALREEFGALYGDSSRLAFKKDCNDKSGFAEDLVYKNRVFYVVNLVNSQTGVGNPGSCHGFTMNALRLLET